MKRIAYDELTEQLRLFYAKLLQRHPVLSDLGSKERFELLKRLCSDKDPETARLAAAWLGLILSGKTWSAWLLPGSYAHAAWSGS